MKTVSLYGLWRRNFSSDSEDSSIQLDTMQRILLLAKFHGHRSTQFATGFRSHRAILSIPKKDFPQFPDENIQSLKKIWCMNLPAPMPTRFGWLFEWSGGRNPMNTTWP
ncbi:uncharacterized protein L3040_000545 [Drepanopeziza brunnea f. sp. 'multigermtubi']|uniref:uncharacterized protein n=1 Tax=Drepanopeziza brunnea f. sp. 'multigermtubi' TaxID=698441 RepID=UPI00238F6290|nr:hypothetical protein L3040_000545 [Drepanopeziza brunnea f. sp. 'multigermtubi']